MPPPVSGSSEPAVATPGSWSQLVAASWPCETVIVAVYEREPLKATA